MTFNRTHQPPLFAYFMESGSRCGNASSFIVFIRPEAQLDFLKSATPEDEEYFLTMMMENGERKVQDKLYQHTMGAMERKWERRHNNAVTTARRFQEIVSTSP